MRGNNFGKYFLAPVVLFAGLCLLAACRQDLFGFINPTDLNRRLEEKDSYKFLTPAELSPADNAADWGSSFSFVVVADIHIENEETYKLEALMNKIAAGQITAKGAAKDIKFVVLAGDISQGGYRSELEKFIRAVEPVRAAGIPCYPVIGNHDIFFNNWRIWRELIGSTRYRVDGGGATLFVLDSANAFFGTEQLDWLDAEITKTTGHVFVFSHGNLFVQNPTGVQQISDVRETARICSMLKNRCAAMIMGHSHERCVKETGGVQYIAVESLRDNKTYCVISVDGSGRVEYSFEEL